MSTNLYVVAIFIAFVFVASIVAPAAMAYVDCQTAMSEVKPHDQASLLKATRICEAVGKFANEAAIVIQTKK